MTREKVMPVLTFALSLIVSVIIGTAYLHTAFASKKELREVKVDLTNQMNRIEDKIDKTWTGPKRVEMSK